MLDLVLLKMARNWAKALLQPLPLIGILKLPQYISDWLEYSRKAGVTPKIMDTQPCLTDRTASTPFDPHYFFQGAWLSRKLAQRMPTQHVDVSSSVMTIAALSGFVDTVFVDYRPLQVTIPGLDCRVGDITKLPFEDGSVESLSCLHVIEHIGLGRYGDTINPDGSRKGLKELSRVLAKGGHLYISVPVGRERICFNAHRVFDPRTIVSFMTFLDLSEFSLVDDRGLFRQNQPIEEGAAQEYGCGLFIFQKPE